MSLILPTTRIFKSGSRYLDKTGDLRITINNFFDESCEEITPPPPLLFLGEEEEEEDDDDIDGLSFLFLL